MAWIVLGGTLAVAAMPAVEPTVDELKAKISLVSVGDRPKLCVEIAQQQLTATGKLFTEADDEKAQAALTDVVSYSEQARDYSIQSHKHEKQTEIAVRGMTRKLADLVHTLTKEEQGPVKDAIQRLQRVRDDLLMSMFPKGAK